MQVEGHGRVDVTCAGPHDQALQGREAHGGVDRAAAAHGRGGGPVAEVQHDLVDRLDVAAEEGGGGAGDEPVGGAVGAVAAHLVLLGDLLLQRVGGRLLREIGEERGVRHDHVRHLRQ